MTTVDRPPSAAPSGQPPVVCPHLRATTGEWRSGTPSREHVCGAETPATPLGLETQRRFCLADPTSCERYRAAADARLAFAPTLPVRPIARTAPVVIERGRSALAIPVAVDRRTVGQAGLALVMIAAAAALIVARGSSPGGSSGSSPIPSASSAGLASSIPSPTPTPSTSPSPSPSPSATPKATPKPTAKPKATYRVRAGDTLGAIAVKFGTTVKAIKALNGIKDASLIRPGQVLKIP